MVLWNTQTANRIFTVDDSLGITAEVYFDMLMKFTACWFWNSLLSLLYSSPVTVRKQWDLKLPNYLFWQSDLSMKYHILVSFEAGCMIVMVCIITIWVIWDSASALFNFYMHFQSTIWYLFYFAEDRCFVLYEETSKNNGSDGELPGVFRISDELKWMCTFIWLLLYTSFTFIFIFSYLYVFYLFYL